MSGGRLGCAGAFVSPHGLAQCRAPQAGRWNVSFRLGKFEPPRTMPTVLRLPHFGRWAGIPAHQAGDICERFPRGKWKDNRFSDEDGYLILLAAHPNFTPCSTRRPA